MHEQLTDLMTRNIDCWIRSATASCVLNYSRMSALVGKTHSSENSEWSQLPRKRDIFSKAERVVTEVLRTIGRRKWQ